MKASELVGKKALRTAPMQGNYGTDNSYSSGKGILILKVTDHHIYFQDGDYQSTLNFNWLDNNWTEYDDTVFAKKIIN